MATDLPWTYLPVHILLDLPELVLLTAGAARAIAAALEGLVIDEAPAGSTAASGGVIQDRDVQLLVNDLWAAGAAVVGWLRDQIQLLTRTSIPGHAGAAIAIAEKIPSSRIGTIEVRPLVQMPVQATA